MTKSIRSILEGLKPPWQTETHCKDCSNATRGYNAALVDVTANIDKAEAAINAYVEERVTQAEKAFGGCKKCYGKGYATVLDAWDWHDTDTDIGSPGGRGKNEELKMKPCICDRGKQLGRWTKKENNND